MSPSPAELKADPLAETVDMPKGLDLEQLIAKHFGPPPSPLRFEFGAGSHPGKARANNEDHYGVVRRRRGRDVLFTNLPEGFLPAVSDESYALAVADGIGGAAFGEVASMFALRAGWDLTSKAFKWHFQLTEREKAELLEMIQVYGQLIHRRLGHMAQADAKLAGMGTTLTAAILVGSDAVIGHVGDSRAYLWRDGVLRQLTRDHTRAQEMVDMGMIESLAEAPTFLRHVLVNCLGAHPGEVEVDVHHVPLIPGDRLLLCTDGLSDMVADDGIARTLEGRPHPLEACQALVDLALEHGGRDNVTVVLASVAA